MKKQKISFCKQKKLTKCDRWIENFRMKTNFSKTMIEELLLLLQKKSKFPFFSHEIRSLTNFKIFVDFSEFSKNFETNKKNVCER